MRFNLKYFLLTLLLFTIEVLIALYGGGWIRSYLGDVLVVILIFTFIKTFFVIDTLPCVIGVVVFSFIVEITQYFKLVRLLGLQHNELAVIILGNTFHWLDLVSYAVGGMIIIIIDMIKKLNRR